MEEKDYEIKFFVAAKDADEAVEIFMNGIQSIESNDWIPEVSPILDPDFYDIKPEGTI
jgi:hypothetical protein|tara:strand:+ start:4214 stop:4387 length:174 start_codon:yes stop_codon:yes gene_type:complete